MLHSNHIQPHCHTWRNTLLIKQLLLVLITSTQILRSVSVKQHLGEVIESKYPANPPLQLISLCKINHLASCKDQLSVVVTFQPVLSTMESPPQSSQSCIRAMTSLLVCLVVNLSVVIHGICCPTNGLHRLFEGQG